MIDAAKLNGIFLSSMFEEGEEVTNPIIVQGIVCNVAFDPIRLENARDEVVEMLLQLPDEFKKSIGGGWSFLYMCNDKEGNLWTGEHKTMEQLVLLGLALKKVECLMPRDMWKILPGGMPYYVILDE